MTIFFSKSIGIDVDLSKMKFDDHAIIIGVMKIYKLPKRLSRTRSWRAGTLNAPRELRVEKLNLILSLSFMESLQVRRLEFVSRRRGRGVTMRDEQTLPGKSLLRCTTEEVAVAEREEARPRQRLRLQLLLRRKTTGLRGRESEEVAANRRRCHVLVLDLVHDHVLAPSPFRVNSASRASLYCSLSSPGRPMDPEAIRFRRLRPEIQLPSLPLHRRLPEPWTFPAVRHRLPEAPEAAARRRPVAPARSSRTAYLRHNFRWLLNQQNRSNGRATRWWT